MSEREVAGHGWSTVKVTATRIWRECQCGHATFGDIPEPAHHTPLADREAVHLAEMAAIADGSVWDQIPASHSFELVLRRRCLGQEPADVAVFAVWMGGSRLVLSWPWTSEGLAEAQAWCDNQANTRHVLWSRSGTPVRPGDLAKHAP